MSYKRKLWVSVLIVILLDFFQVLDIFFQNQNSDWSVLNVMCYKMFEIEVISELNFLKAIRGLFPVIVCIILCASIVVEQGEVDKNFIITRYKSRGRWLARRTIYIIGGMTAYATLHMGILFCASEKGTVMEVTADECGRILWVACCWIIYLCTYVLILANVKLFCPDEIMVLLGIGIPVLEITMICARIKICCDMSLVYEVLRVMQREPLNIKLLCSHLLVCFVACLLLWSLLRRKDIGINKGKKDEPDWVKRNSKK